MTAKNQAAVLERIIGTALAEAELARLLAGQLDRLALMSDEIAALARGLRSPALAILTLIDNTKGMPMAGSITVKDTDTAFGATVTFLDAKGAVTHPDDVPQWESSDGSIVALVASDDGLSATLTPGTPGAATVTVNSTDTDGTQIAAQGTVTVEPGEAVLGDVEFTPPTA